MRRATVSNRRSRAVLKLAARLMRLWPPADRLPRVPRPVPARDGNAAVDPLSVPPASQPHAWISDGGLTLCRNCWSPWYELQCVACPGMPRFVRQLSQCPQGHRWLMLRTVPDTHLVMCTRCGSWSTGHVRSKSARACTWPTGAGKSALRRVGRGLHPSFDKPHIAVSVPVDVVASML